MFRRLSLLACYVTWMSSSAYAITTIGFPNDFLEGKSPPSIQLSVSPNDNMEMSTKLISAQSQQITMDIDLSSQGNLWSGDDNMLDWFIGKDSTATMTMNMYGYDKDNKHINFQNEIVLPVDFKKEDYGKITWSEYLNNLIINSFWNEKDKKYQTNVVYPNTDR